MSDIPHAVVDAVVVQAPTLSDDFDGCLDLLLCLCIYLLGLSVPLLCLFCGYFFFLFLDVLLMGLRQLHALV